MHARRKVVHGHATIEYTKIRRERRWPARDGVTEQRAQEGNAAQANGRVGRRDGEMERRNGGADTQDEDNFQK